MYLAKLCVIAAESDQLFTDRASTVGVPLAGLGVADHPLHLVARGKAAVGVTALADVDQALDAPLDGQLARLLGVVGCRVLGRPAVQVEPEALHLVDVTLLLVAGDAQVEVVADGAVVACLHALLTVVARVHKFVLTLQTKCFKI